MWRFSWFIALAAILTALTAAQTKSLTCHTNNGQVITDANKVQYILVSSKLSTNNPYVLTLARAVRTIPARAPLALRVSQTPSMTASTCAHKAPMVPARASHILVALMASGAGPATSRTATPRTSSRRATPVWCPPLCMRIGLIMVTTGPVSPALPRPCRWSRISSGSSMC
jgi:hypothetical protein